MTVEYLFWMIVQSFLKGVRVKRKQEDILELNICS